MDNPALHAALKADYETIRDEVRNERALSGKLGRYVQPRTKGAGHGSTSRAFYARKELVAHLLNIAPISFDDKLVQP